MATSPEHQYSLDAAVVLNSRRMYEKPFEEMMYLADQFRAYETREDLPPELLREFEECLASGVYDFNSPSEGGDG